MNRQEEFDELLKQALKSPEVREFFEIYTDEVRELIREAVEYCKAMSNKYYATRVSDSADE